MARILQIRRGTSAQNDNFTGMLGEISFDTEAKTLRVHDGQTLGGFALARADQINQSENTTDINLNDVPDEFWKNIFEKFTPQKYDSPMMFINTAVPATECVFDTLKTEPISVRVILVCHASEAGYAVGEEVCAFGIGNRTNPVPNIRIADDGLHICLMVAKQAYWVSNKTTGDQTNITPDNWRMIFRVYC